MAAAAIPSTEKTNFLQKCNQTSAICKQIDKYLELRGSFPRETKLMLWIDRLQLASLTLTWGWQQHVTPSSTLIPELTEKEMDLTDHVHHLIDTTMDRLVDELQCLFQHVLDISAEMKKIQRKLDTVLEGPDYEHGHQIMISAKEELSNLASQIKPIH